MTRVQDVCHEVRSKNAGPFWVTVDLFFNDAAAFERYAASPALGADAFARPNTVALQSLWLIR